MAYNRNNRTEPTKPQTNDQKANTVRKFTSLDGTNMRVFVREFDGRVSASVSIGVKNEDDGYDNAYIPVYFANVVPPADGMCTIHVKQGFWSAYYSKKYDTMLPKIVVMAYEEV